MQQKKCSNHTSHPVNLKLSVNVTHACQKPLRGEEASVVTEKFKATWLAVHSRVAEAVHYLYGVPQSSFAAVNQPGGCTAQGLSL